MFSPLFDMADFYESLLELKRIGIPLMVVVAVAKEGAGPVDVGKKMVVAEDGTAFGTVGGGAIEFYAKKKCVELMQKHENLLETYLLSEGKIIPETKTLPMACGGRVTLFYEYVGPKEFVYIFGAGHVAKALGYVLRTLGFYLIVIDDRQDVLDDYPYASEKHANQFVPFIDEVGIRENSMVVVSTPSHEYDYHVLNRILEKKIQLKYFGMLCSPSKLDDYLENTYKAFGNDLDLSDFYAPIGLDLGGNTPEEIAVSIASEMLAVSNQRPSGMHMRETRHGKYRYW
ncbi:MAG TPA: XdhC/CoxI family protein [Bacillota bacterium]|nr:XdhC/CoxI family protein [Bacillota bacterium]HPF42541.1 XdhC/CoxI family protein [Bacillota bacterium]HPJ86015.1 XdhC/CoxI family protein [Bacillota bacterium]HPQ62042.1 XdhC/CoxI family protein [Bacillota bacterium]HRX91554.1 XdhC/CoxI family protein [Candidatus Izemoplasmatales bacterium]